MAVTSNYSGAFLENILVQLSTGNPTVKNGAIMVHSGVQKNLSIPRLEVSNVMKDYVASPGPSDSGTYTYDEKDIDVKEYMLYLEYDPNDFSDVWEPFQAQGAFVFHELPRAVQMAMIEDILRVHDQQLELLIYQGDSALSSPNLLRFFDGAIKKGGADAATIDVSTPVALTSGNIEGEIKRVYQSMPVQVKNHPDTKIFMSVEDYDKWLDAQEAKTYKGTNSFDVAPARFRNIPFFVTSGMPENTMFATYTNATRFSNMHLALKFKDDTMTVKTGPVANNSEMHFIKMALKGGVVFSWYKYLVGYNL